MNCKTAGEIFQDAHEELQLDSSDWLKYTSKNFSAVTTLVASVSFASARNNIPGGTDNNGNPNLEGNPAIYTRLLDFAIYTHFSKAIQSLPLKLLLALCSLFVSIVAMLVAFCIGNSLLFSNFEHKIY
ncbi:hypothetical protein JHK82_038827 [Glycine max]|nr:hypothetical protein JHK82_038827 [Glycine max]KAG5120895.1 hypothetical protein JHK84_039235 [Glycine max]KAH1093124.1 hypothetical protein GYH30_039048 [Glycine max]